MSVEKDADEETLKASPRLWSGARAGRRPRAVAYGGTACEERRAESSREQQESRPSYATADVAKPTAVVRPDFFLLGLVKRSWAATTGYMNGTGAPEEEKQRPPFLRKAKTRSGSRAKQLWVPK